MTTPTKPRYLSDPRDGPDELPWLRSQAEVYNTVLKDSPFHILVAACSRCASDDMYKNDYRNAFVCNKCGNVDSATDIKSGRIALR